MSPIKVIAGFYISIFVYCATSVWRWKFDEYEKVVF